MFKTMNLLVMFKTTNLSCLLVMFKTTTKGTHYTKLIYREYISKWTHMFHNLYYFVKIMLNI